MGYQTFYDGSQWEIASVFHQTTDAEFEAFDRFYLASNPKTEGGGLAKMQNLS